MEKNDNLSSANEWQAISIRSMYRRQHGKYVYISTTHKENKKLCLQHESCRNKKLPTKHDDDVQNTEWKYNSVLKSDNVTRWKICSHIYLDQSRFEQEKWHDIYVPSLVFSVLSAPQIKMRFLTQNSCMLYVGDCTPSILDQVTFEMSQCELEAAPECTWCRTHSLGILVGFQSQRENTNCN